MYKIFVNDIPVYLASEGTDHVLNRDSATLQVSYQKPSDLRQIVDYLYTKPNLTKVIIMAENPKSLYRDFSEPYKKINAAGGLVVNKNNEVLMIFRNGKWDLPKGKVEKNEKIEDAAVREIAEETGIVGAIIKEPLSVQTDQTNFTLHTYFEKNGKRILKSTYWYFMEYSGKAIGVPQQEEGISKVEWIKWGDLKEICFQNTYGSIKDVIESGAAYLLKTS